MGLMDALDINQEWRKRASCRGAENLFFATDGTGKGGARKSLQEEIAKAQKICFGCPVREQCLEYAVSTPGIVNGVWGGLTTKQISKVRRQWLKATNNGSRPQRFQSE